MPVARLLPLALRVGAAAGTAWAVTRVVRARLNSGRTDQRAEDALDDLPEGLALHAPKDRAEDAQKNAAFRLRRVIRWRGEAVELDASLLGRIRLRRLPG